MIWIPAIVTLCAVLWALRICLANRDGDVITGLAALWDLAAAAGLAALAWIVYGIVR